jgi:hypothetical protein
MFSLERVRGSQEEDEEDDDEDDLKGSTKPA